MARRAVDQSVPGVKVEDRRGRREYSATPGTVWERDGKYYRIDEGGKTYSDISATEYEASERKLGRGGGFDLGKWWEREVRGRQRVAEGASFWDKLKMGVVAGAGPIGMAAAGSDIEREYQRRRAAGEEEPTVEGPGDKKLSKNEFIEMMARNTGLPEDIIKEIQKKVDKSMGLGASIYKNAAAAMEAGINLDDAGWQTQLKDMYDKDPRAFDELTYKPEYYQTEEDATATGEADILQELALDFFPDDEASQRLFKLSYAQSGDWETAMSQVMRRTDPSYLSPTEQRQYDLEVMRLNLEPERWLQRFRAEHGELPSTPGWLDPFVSAAQGEQITGKELPEAVGWEQLAKLSPQKQAQLQGMFEFMGQPFEEYKTTAKETAWETYEPADLAKRTGAWGTWGWR